ncbi:hypothetical protein ACFQU7_14430 [Pseudoroseomonas wenyumeiae]
MTLSRRALLSASLALPLAMPALRRAAADPVARLALLHMNDFHSKHEGTDAGSASCRIDKPCLGGSARLAGAMAMRRRKPPRTAAPCCSWMAVTSSWARSSTRRTRAAPNRPCSASSAPRP